MSIVMEDIINLPVFKTSKLIAGEAGLNRQIRWIYVGECFQDPVEWIKWLQGSELIFITGSKFNGNYKYIEEIIMGIYQVNAAGILINIGPYIDRVPEEAIKLANELRVPIIEVPWDVKFLDISKEVTSKIMASDIEKTTLSELLSSILFGNIENIVGDPIKKAAYFGYDLQGDCCTAIIDIDKFQLYLDRRKIEDENEITRIKIKFRRVVEERLRAHGLNIPMIDKDDAVILILKADRLFINRVNKVFIEIQKELKIKLDVTVSIGIGNGYSYLALMKESLKEAEMAIKYSKIYGLDNSIERYENINQFKLLFKLENNELEKYHLDVLEPILDNNKKKNETSYVEILEVYLEENCNVTITAEKLFLHRNTLKYKLKKIEELLNCDLRNFNNCAKLKLALDIRRILKLSVGTKIL